MVGGAHRLGKAIALDLAQAGADVAISYHTSAHAADATRAEIEARGVRTAAFAAEAGDPAQMAALIDSAVVELGGLEIVVYCPSAGFLPVRPEDVTEDLFDAAFGGFDALKQQLIDAGVNRFGSGWSWLVVDDGTLKVVSTANQDSPLMDGQTPILGIDVWEHAYYLKYQNKRPDYIGAFWNVVNWDEVNRRLEAAK